MALGATLPSARRAAATEPARVAAVLIVRHQIVEYSCRFVSLSRTTLFKTVQNCSTSSHKKLDFSQIADGPPWHRACDSPPRRYPYASFINDSRLRRRYVLDALACIRSRAWQRIGQAACISQAGDERQTDDQRQTGPVDDDSQHGQADDQRQTGRIDDTPNGQANDQRQTDDQQQADDQR